MGKCDKWQKDYEKMQSSGVVNHELMHLISPPRCKRHPKRGEGGGEAETLWTYTVNVTWQA